MKKCINVEWIDKEQPKGNKKPKNKGVTVEITTNTPTEELFTNKKKN